MAVPKFTDFKRWIGEALTKVEWDFNIRKWISFFTDGTADMTINSLTTTTDVTVGDDLSVGGVITGNGSGLSNVPSTASSLAYRIVSGQAKTSGYPKFLTVTGSDNKVKLGASNVNFVAVINDTTLTLTSDIELDGLATAPAANNTCAVADASYANNLYTKTEGEFDDTYIKIDAEGSNIVAKANTVAGFKHGAGPECFSGTVLQGSGSEAHCIIRAVRGDAESTREEMADNDTITLMEIAYIFLDIAGTLHQTSTYPQRLPTAPTTVANAYYFNTDTLKWYYSSDGASWAATDRILIGHVYSDNTSAKKVAMEDFNSSAWDSKSNYLIAYHDTSSVVVQLGEESVASNRVTRDYSKGDLVTFADLDTGSKTSETLYYLYVRPTAKYELSVSPPRTKHFKARKQALKVDDYHRCLGSIYTDASGNVVKFIVNDSFYMYAPNGTGAANTGVNAWPYDKKTITSSFARYNFTSCPPNQTPWMQTYAATDILYKRKRGNTFGFVELRYSVVGNDLDQGQLSSYIQNSTAELKLETGNQVNVAIYGWHLNY